MTPRKTKPKKQEPKKPTVRRSTKRQPRKKRVVPATPAPIRTLRRSFFSRLFNFDPKRDFGVLDELVGGFLVLLIVTATVTIIFGKEVTTSWVETSVTDWKKGTLQHTDIVGTSDKAALGLTQQGGGWTIREKPSSDNITLVAMLSTANGWAVGEKGKIWKTINGGVTWQETTSGTTEDLWSVAFADTGTGIAVGNEGVLLSWNGSSWNAIDSPISNMLLGVALEGSKGFAVGSEGKILVKENNNWKEDKSPTGKALYSVAMTGTTAFAVGENGTILKWDGATWSTVPSPTTQTLLSVRLLNDSFGIAVGESGTILHWNGAQWTKKASGTTQDLSAVAIATSNAAFAGGANGTIIHWNGSNWIAGQLNTPESIFGIALPTSTKGVAIGTSGFVATYESASYAMEGTYTSATKDAGKEVAWDTIQWSETAPRGTSVKLQVAANNDNATWVYLGPDQSQTSYYTNESGQKINASLSKQRYFRYRATLETNDSIQTPLLNATTILSKEEVADAPPPQEESKKEEPLPATPVKEEIKKSEQPEQPTVETPPSTPQSQAPLSTPLGTSSGGGSAPSITIVAPQLTVPTNNALAESAKVQLQWLATPATPGYTIEIDQNIAFTAPVIRASVHENSYTPDSALPIGSYFWRVRSDIPETPIMRGDWSTIYTFTLTNKAPLPKVAAPTITKPVTLDSTTITLEGVAFPNAVVRLIITSTLVERNVITDDNGVWSVSVPRSLFDSGQHLVQAQTIAEGQITPAVTVGEFFIPFPPPPPKNAAVATARAIQQGAKRAVETTERAARKTVAQTAIVAAQTETVIQENKTEATAALGVTVPIVTVANPTVLPLLPNLHLLLYHFISGVLSLFGIRKKRRPWGVVYDAITKEPIGLAIVRLFDAQSKKLLETQVTDNDGRFGFLVQPSAYTLEVAKQDFMYPSTLVSGKTDGDFDACYYGDPVQAKEGVINVSIPLDPLNKKEARQKQPVAAILKGTMHAIALPLLVVGWAVSWLITLFAYSPTNLAMTLFYLVFAIIHVVFTAKKLRPWGTVFASETLEPVPLAVISIIDTKFNRVLKTRLTDYSGRFNFLPPAGEYKLTVKKEGFSFPAKEKPVTRRFKNLYFGQDIIVKKEKAIVNTDVPVEKR